jgi:hypothetical protein
VGFPTRSATSRAAVSRRAYAPDAAGCARGFSARFAMLGSVFWST